MALFVSLSSYSERGGPFDLPKKGEECPAFSFPTCSMSNRAREKKPSNGAWVEGGGDMRFFDRIERQPLSLLQYTPSSRARNQPPKPKSHSRSQGKENPSSSSSVHSLPPFPPLSPLKRAHLRTRTSSSSSSSSSSSKKERAGRDSPIRHFFCTC